jgi:chromosome segregation ATPase
MSFSDLMSSGRGPGVVGMLMALMVLVGFGILFMYASGDMARPASQSIEFIVAEQSKEIQSNSMHLEALKKVLSKLPERDAMKNSLTEKKQSIKTGQEKIANLKSNVQSKQAEIAVEEAKLETYKNEYRAHVRNKAKGQTMETLTTRNGSVYKNVNIREVTAVGLQIRHDDGLKRIQFEELSDELMDYYQYDPNQKQKALQKEEETRTLHEAEVAQAQAINSEQLAQQQSLDAERKNKETQRQIVERESRMSQIRSEIQNLKEQKRRAKGEASAAKSGGKLYIDRRVNYDADIQFKQSQIEQLAAEISQLKNSR